MVRAQFKCKEILLDEYGQCVRMEVDMHGCKDFTPYTPSGAMEFRIDKKAPSIGMFEVGKVYNVDFSPVEDK